ncbi:NUDIX hydrolase [Bifidobacterium sp. ESL0798]|uniref:NUDIX hydrolase n=1 Tax=unclassified Bifidobacterium TaxID=2608897 RepID=UPI0023F729CE|nr:MULTISPECIES: NUDIX hydrolase [unclassified Bifidobacterium]WEV53500.1 NUDIX hydrolase [Bifidobacterium sp. ESL0704]WEV73526.1 NUDIX hydrolase [Bifidobacterium sp. ESL0798]
MWQGNVTERKAGPPEVGVSVIIFALAHAHDSQEKKTGKATHDELWIPLVRRVREPFKGMWALPGGGLLVGRSLEWSAFVALESTTNLRPRYLEQLYTFGDPHRSGSALPMVSIVYWALIGSTQVDDLRDGDNVRWFAESALPPLAFDHAEIIRYALDRLRSRMSYPDVASKLVGPRFTLRRLHDVYEAIAGRTFDLGNFRRKMLASGQLEDTGEKLAEGRHRPAAVYRYVPEVVAKGNEIWKAWDTELNPKPVGSVSAYDPSATSDDALSPLTTD